MTRTPKRLIAVIVCACAAHSTGESDAIAQTAGLQPHEYIVWEGEWLMSGSDLEDNVYTILRIWEVDAGGFKFETECRNIPYGPNATWGGEERAEFEGPLEASRLERGMRFGLSVNPDDRYDRVLEMRPLQCSHTDAPSNTFAFRRAVFRAGFDCDRAATSVERVICGNELLAQGDFETGALYRELIDSLADSAADELRLEQRAWLRKRNGDCVSENVVDEACIAHVYADRLVSLARLADPELGAAPRFDAAYALARIVRGADLRRDTAFRLAMYPLTMDPAGSSTWWANPDGLLFEQTYSRTRTVWPTDVEFLYLDMLYVDRDGTVWTVQRTQLAQPLYPDSGIGRDRLWIEAGRGPLTVRTEAGPDAPRPEPVARWLSERGVDEASAVR